MYSLCDDKIARNDRIGKKTADCYCNTLERASGLERLAPRLSAQELVLSPSVGFQQIHHIPIFVLYKDQLRLRVSIGDCSGPSGLLSLETDVQTTYKMLSTVQLNSKYHRPHKDRSALEA